MIDATLRVLVEHPKRGWIVITATFVVAVVFTWPAVDYYFAAREHRSTLLEELAVGDATKSRLELYEKQFARQTEKLGELEDRTVAAEQVEAFRNEVTEWVKESGCQLRRVKLADVQLRQWYDEDHPLEVRNRSDKDKKTPFKLRQQQLNVLVTGPMERVSDFLGYLSEQEKFVHTGSLQLRRSPEDRRVVEMDLDLILFDLAHDAPQ